MKRIIPTIVFALSIALIGVTAFAQTTQAAPDIDVNLAAWMQILRLGIAGGLVAFFVDLHAWSKSDKDEEYDWKLMAKRVIGGIAGNVLAGMGMSAVTGGMA